MTTATKKAVTKKATAKKKTTTVPKRTALDTKVSSYIKTVNSNWVRKAAKKNKSTLSKVIDDAITEARKNTSK